MEQRKLKAIILGCGDRGLIYANYIKAHPLEVELVGIAEPDEGRRTRIQQLHNLSDNCCVTDYKELMARDKFADFVIVSTQDKMHFDPTMLALRKKYDVLLEKPMSPDLHECIAMVEEADKYGRKLVVCHVLRYSPFFKKVKDIIDSGEIGNIVSIQHSENVGYWHQAHSFVRGSWRNSDECCPMILAKCCHDLDLMNWIIESQCVNISSFGSLTYFNKEHAPKGCAERCADLCLARENCPYDATEIYYRHMKDRTIDGKFAWPLSAMTSGSTREDVTAAIKYGPYGRCVYHCDNNVVDHQVVNLRYQNDVTVSFTMCAFTPDISRSLRVMGTEGAMDAYTTENHIIVKKFKTRETIQYMPTICKSGHGGGDDGLFNDFIWYVRDGIKTKSITDAKISLASHVIALAAEESRIKNQCVTFKDFYNKNH